MVMTVFVFMGLALAADTAVVPSISRPTQINPRAAELFDREPRLKEWALRVHDRNRDGWLTLYEAHVAAMAFREIADGNSDGQVSVSEYRAGLDFVRARY
jgi:hypothetical protein